MIRYRRPKQDDPVIIDLVKKELVPHSSMSRPELEKAVSNIPRRLTQGVTLVASPYYEADPVAFIHFMIHGELLYIDMMAVCSNQQRKRHGKTLMAHAENLAASRGCTHAKVLVDQENIRAHLFYQKSGYETVRYIPVSRCFELEKRLMLRL